MSATTKTLDVLEEWFSDPRHFTSDTYRRGTVAAPRSTCALGGVEHAVFKATGTKPFNSSAGRYYRNFDRRTVYGRVVTLLDRAAREVYPGLSKTIEREQEGESEGFAVPTIEGLTLFGLEGRDHDEATQLGYRRVMRVLRRARELA